MKIKHNNTIRRSTIRSLYKMGKTIQSIASYLDIPAEEVSAALQSQGDRKPRTTVTPDEKVRIYNEVRKLGKSARVTAEDAGLSVNTIYAILKVGDMTGGVFKDNRRRKLTTAQCDEIRVRYLLGGESAISLAEEFGVAVPTLYRKIKNQ